MESPGGTTDNSQGQMRRSACRPWNNVPKNHPSSSDAVGRTDAPSFPPCSISLPTGFSSYAVPKAILLIDSPRNVMI
jgi:hypothetical protein